MDTEMSANGTMAAAGPGDVVRDGMTGLGAVEGVVLDLAPDLGRWLFSPSSAAVVPAVQAAVAVAAGSADPGTQARALADRRVASVLRIALLRIVAEQAALAEQGNRAALDSRMDALVERAGAAQPAAGSGSIAWGVPIVSVVVLLTFWSVIALTLTKAMPPGAEPVLNVLLGTLGAMATSVVGYWVGSSAGSARKEARRASLADR